VNLFTIKLAMALFETFNQKLPNFADHMYNTYYIRHLVRAL